MVSCSADHSTETLLVPSSGSHSIANFGMLILPLMISAQVETRRSFCPYSLSVLTISAFIEIVVALELNALAGPRWSSSLDLVPIRTGSVRKSTAQTSRLFHLVRQREATRPRRNGIAPVSCSSPVITLYRRQTQIPGRRLGRHAQSIASPVLLPRTRSHHCGPAGQDGDTVSWRTCSEVLVWLMRQSERAISSGNKCNNIGECT